ncbi:MAG TPA: PAS domain S-box protein [Gemmataceae bacterium]|nr:PAS domain S-box protein [Gemmataceae bacterium]
MAAKKSSKKSAQPPSETHEPAEADPLARKPSEPPVAGIGASAGGLDAFKKFFTAMPPDSGIAFVLVPHLDPAHESLMVELMSRHTAMPVVEAENDMPVEANHVYIIPPNKYMTIRGGTLRLTGPVERHASQTSIDLFLRSLADDRQERSICIILSGTGSHGTLGLKAVKAAGGMAMVQDPATAEYPRMPQSAIATGLTDYVLPVERMPDALLKYVQHGYLNGGTQVEGGPEAPDHLTQVLALLRTRTRFDFRCYRKEMLTRRIERRMGLSHFDNIHDYVMFLREHPEEVKQLVKDLFISVTSCFRDPEAFVQLANLVLAPLVQSKEADAVIRVWVPGCATGEEPYSIAMLLQEQLAAVHKGCRVQIFATDVDEDALETARHGLYPDSISADVSPERLVRFFVKVEGEHAYQVNKALRETVIFAVQNLISDAPFTKLDLISCRNLLIYLEADVQKKVLTLFHFALREGGFLFLGSSETIGRQVDLFEPLSKKRRLYRRIGAARPEHVDFPIMAATEGAGAGRRRVEGGAAQPINFAEVTQRLLLEQFAPAAVLINRKYEIFYYFGPCTRYLEFPTGEPTHDLMRMAREGLSTRLRGAIHRAIRDSESVVLTGIRVKRNGSYSPARVTVRPIQAPKAAEGLLLITFEDEAASEPPSSSLAPPAPVEAGDEDAIRQLEYELKATREDLQSTIEELESSNEELKASNEEILSMNEELQSANEELETSKEELQSLNEELNTVNNQLHDKFEDLESANNDMANLLNSTAMATVFLDRDFRIKLFMPAATKLFNLIASDIGRPIGDITARFDDPDLLGDAEEVLHQLAPREKEVSTAEGVWWGRRIMPYRTRDNRIEGVVITFVDITERKKAADAVVRRLASIVESSVDAIFSKDLDGIIQTWNQGAERLYGYPAAEAVGRSFQMLIPQERSEEWRSIMARVRRGEGVEGLETERIRKDGQRVPVRLSISPLRDGSGKVVSASTIVRDISESKRAEEALRDSEEHLQAILSTAADAILTIDRNGIVQSANPSAERMFGYAAAGMIGQNVKMLMPPPYRDEHDGYLARYLQTGEKRIIGIGREVEARRKDGSVFPVDLAVSEIEHLKLFTGIIRDITQRKELEREVIEIASLEQRRIGNDLHDTVGQELTALNLLAKDLAETLQNDASKATPLLEQMIQGLQRSQQDLRAVLRGLLPVSVDTEGLMAALADLADHTQKEGKVVCVFDCPTPVSIADNLTATHLYLIAQEAVHNAVKHAHAKEIRIALESNEGLVLRIQDDGTGIADRPVAVRGLGLRIMRNRAAIIGAKLAIEPAQPSGTLVTCVLARKYHEPE